MCKALQIYVLPSTFQMGFQPLLGWLHKQLTMLKIRLQPWWIVNLCGWYVIFLSCMLYHFSYSLVHRYITISLSVGWPCWKLTLTKSLHELDSEEFHYVQVVYCHLSYIMVLSWDCCRHLTLYSDAFSNCRHCIPMLSLGRTLSLYTIPVHVSVRPGRNVYENILNILLLLTTGLGGWFHVITTVLIPLTAQWLLTILDHLLFGGGEQLNGFLFGGVYPSGVPDLHVVAEMVIVW